MHQAVAIGHCDWKDRNDFNYAIEKVNGFM